MVSDKLYTVQTASEYLQVDQMTIRNYIKKGWLKAFRLGESKRTVIRIKPEDLQEFLNRNNGEAK